MSAALSAVVMVRAGQSWATGVVASPSGVVVTNAHLLAPQQEPAALQGNACSSGDSAAAAAHVRPRRYPAVRVRVSGGGARWLVAEVVYVFGGHLDLAVLQVAGLQAPLPGLPLAPPESPSPGERVFVLSHVLVGPPGELQPSVTRGSAARVIKLPPTALGGAPRASMLLTTAAVHAGASGGAVVNAAGQLVGLVTSNARHTSGGTLPRLNFCVHVDELRPLWTWAAAWAPPPAGAPARNFASAGGRTRMGASATELAALDRREEAAAALWALRDPAVPPARAHAPRLPAQLGQQLRLSGAPSVVAGSSHARHASHSKL